MTEVTMSTLGQDVLDDLRRLAGWAVLDTSWLFTTEAGGIGPDEFATLRAQANIYGRLRELGYPQHPDYPYGLRDEDVPVLRAAAEREIVNRSTELEYKSEGRTPYGEATHEWALTRVELAERVLAHLDGLDLEST